MTRDEAKKVLLLETYKKIKNSVQALSHSANKLNPFDPSQPYDLDELEPYDALTSRFERAVEVTINKLFRSIQFYETGISDGTVRDCLNLMLKLKIINDAEEWMEMRDLRNKISHDYLPEQLKSFYDKITQDYSQVLREVIKRVKSYLKDKDIDVVVFDPDNLTESNKAFLELINKELIEY